MRPLVLAVFALLLFAAPSPAYVIQERGGLESYANGITLGPDGNLWAALTGAGKVVRMKPDGTILGHYPVGADPTSITSGPGGRVWVAVTGDDKLVWFDATAATPSPNSLSTASFSDCGPVAIEAGNNGRMYFSLPKDGCEADSKVGYTKDDGTAGGMAAANNRGKAYDLHVSGGKLFVPDFDSNVIRRLALDNALTIESTTSVTGGNPDGITADNTGQIWVTLYSSGKVARFPGTEPNGSAIESAPAGGALVGPFGIVNGPDGRIYVTGTESANIVRIDPLTNQSVFYATPAGSKPWQIVSGPDEDLWFTDLNGNRLLRFVSTKPRATTEPAQVLAATAATLKAKVDPRGNPTSVVFDYGTTPAFGKTTAPVDLADGVGAVDVQVGVQDLAPNTTYHVRVRATNGEGEATGATTIFTTPAGVVDADGDKVSPPADCDDANATVHPGATDVPGDKIDQDCRDGDAAYPLLRAGPRVSWIRLRNGRTMLRKVRVERLAGGETVRITCKGRGCPFKRRTYSKLKAGSRKFDRLFRRKQLRPKAQVQIRITKPATVGPVMTLTMRRGKDPKVVNRCLRPGESRPTKC